jgi:iron-sulfur cluster assembly protein
MMDISLTESAAEHIKKTLAQHHDAIGLRLGTREQGCTGFAYVVEVAKTIEPDDQTFELSGVNIIVNQKSLPILKGTQLDYVTKGLNRSFEFNNPNAEHYCGCGESFSLKSE